MLMFSFMYMYTVLCIYWKDQFYVYVCVCSCACDASWIYAHICTYMCRYIHIKSRLCIRTWVYIYMYASPHTYVCLISMYVLYSINARYTRCGLHINVYMYICTQIYTQIYLYTSIYTNIQTNIYIHQYVYNYLSLAFGTSYHTYNIFIWYFVHIYTCILCKQSQKMI